MSSPPTYDASNPLRVAWISDFPVEWLPEMPTELKNCPRRHPATWQMVLRSEFVKDRALELHIVLLRHRLERPFSFQRNGATFHVLKAAPWLRLASLFWADTLLIRQVCRRIQPHLLHAWGMEKGSPLVAHRLGYPYVMTVQGLYSWYKERVPLSRYDSLIERLERKALPRSPVVTTESNYSVNYLKRRYPHLRVHQAEHAPNPAFFRVQRRPQFAPPQFISVGTLGFRKGTDLLFRVLNELSASTNFKLTLVSGPSSQYLEGLRSSVTPEFWNRIEFKHHLLPDEVAHQLETPTFMLLPTRADVSPNAVKESVVAGLPVVAGDIGGIPDYVQPGKNGMLFKVGDSGAFLEALRAALAHPVLGKGEVAPEALAASRDYLSPARMAQNFKAAYRAALEVSGRGRLAD